MNPFLLALLTLFLVCIAYEIHTSNKKVGVKKHD